MSNIGLFAAGTFVTLIVAAAIVLIVWGTILERRDEKARLTGPTAVPEEPAGFLDAA
jgi:hypothetical protein